MVASMFLAKKVRKTGMPIFSCYFNAYPLIPGEMALFERQKLYIANLLVKCIPGAVQKTSLEFWSNFYQLANV